MTANDDRVARKLHEACLLMGSSSVKELAQKFIAEDQRLLLIHAWDYRNSDLIFNKVKDIIEPILESDITKIDTETAIELSDMLWFWYHHAVGQAIWDSKDRLQAREFSTKALKYQTADNPNQITRLLHILLFDKETEAIAWLKTIKNESDKTLAQGILNEYIAGNFFKS